jgi:hypothetical protein
MELACQCFIGENDKKCNVFRLIAVFRAFKIDFNSP